MSVCVYVHLNKHHNKTSSFGSVVTNSPFMSETWVLSPAGMYMYRVYHVCVLIECICMEYESVNESCMECIIYVQSASCLYMYHMFIECLMSVDVKCVSVNV